jgi:hypothetical protein
MTLITVLADGVGSYVVRVRGGDLFREVIEELKDCIPSSYRRYSPDAKAWRIDSEYYLERWLDEVQWWDGVEVEQRSSRSERQHHYQPPPPPPPPSSRESALATLHLLPSAPPELIRAAHKALAFIHHPDRGGDLERMKAVNNAFDILKAA